MIYSWHPLVSIHSFASNCRRALILAFAPLALSVCTASVLAAPDSPVDDLQKQSNSSAPHLSNLSLVQGVGRRRKANPLPYQPMQEYTNTARSDYGQHEAFLRLLLTAVGFAGILIAILTLRSLPPRRTGI